MKVSIITVCYNSEKTIRDTIDSVLDQDYSNIEYVIVDGVSSDETLNIIGEYGERISKIISEPDCGIYDAMNKGVWASTGEIVGILNSDDFYASSDVISEVVDSFRFDPSRDLIIGDMVYVKHPNLDEVVRTYGSSNFKPWKLKFGWMPPHLATFVKKNAYDRVGQYSLEYKIAADYEMFVRMLLVENLNYARIEKILVKMRVGGVSTAGFSSKLTISFEMVKACRAYGIYTNLLFVMSRFPLKVLETFRKPKD